MQLKHLIVVSGIAGIATLELLWLNLGEQLIDPTPPALASVGSGAVILGDNYAGSPSDPVRQAPLMTESSLQSGFARGPDWLAVPVDTRPVTDEWISPEDQAIYLAEQKGSYAPPTPNYGSADENEPLPPELDPEWPKQSQDELSESSAGRPRIDSQRFSELLNVVRFEADTLTVQRAISELSLYREPDVADALIESARHSGPHGRMASIKGLWRMAANGTESSQYFGIRSTLELAQYDVDPSIAELARTAVADLDALAEPQPQPSDSADMPEMPPECELIDCG